MSYNNVTHKLDMWISNDGPTLMVVNDRLKMHSLGWRWVSLAPATQLRAKEEFRWVIEKVFGGPERLPNGFAREALEDVYDTVDWTSLTADYIDQIAEGEGN